MCHGAVTCCLSLASCGPVRSGPVRGGHLRSTSFSLPRSSSSFFFRVSVSLFRLARVSPFWSPWQAIFERWRRPRQSTQEKERRKKRKRRKWTERDRETERTVVVSGLVRVSSSARVMLPRDSVYRPASPPLPLRLHPAPSILLPPSSLHPAPSSSSPHPPLSSSILLPYSSSILLFLTLLHPPVHPPSSLHPPPPTFIFSITGQTVCSQRKTVRNRRVAGSATYINKVKQHVLSCKVSLVSSVCLGIKWNQFMEIFSLLIKMSSPKLHSAPLNMFFSQRR